MSRREFASATIGDRLFLAAVVLVSALVISAVVYAVVAENAWTARCHRAGGHNVQHDEGIILVPAGKVLVPERQYSDHCIVNGREVRV